MKRFHFFFLDGFDLDEEEFARARLMISFALVEVLFCLVCFVLHPYLSFYTPRIAFLLPVVLLLSTLFLLRLKTGLHLAIQTTIFCFWISFCIGMYFSGGLLSLIAPWLGLLPLMAFTLVNQKNAFVWAGISLTTFAVFAIFHDNLAVPKADNVYGAFVAHLGLAVVIFVFIQLFHRTRQHLLTTITERNNELEVSQKALAARVKEIVDRNTSLEKHWHTLLDISKSRSISFGTLEEALQDITKTGAVSLEAHRVSVWHYDRTSNKIKCLLLYKLKEQDYEKGAELHGEDFPRYFEALLDEEIIPADDAEIDPKTFEFKDNYLKPHHILSMMDAPYFLDGKLGGVICFEHQEHRHWLPEDLLFAKALSDIVPLVIRSIQRRDYEARIRKHKKEVNRLNQSLEERISERTEALAAQNQQLAEYAYINSHQLRGPICRILGLVNLIEESDTKEKEMVGLLRASVVELDDVVKKINEIVDTGASIDRNQLNGWVPSES
jgi:hypothetical protein